MVEVWQVFEDELARTCEKHNLEIHSFVLMSNHFHLLASTPKSNISQCMQQFMHRSSRQLTKRGNRINETFAGRHYKCVMHEPNYFLNAYKYVYRNPVQAGLCARVEEYPFSTLKAVRGELNVKFPLQEDTTYLTDPEGTLEWLNATPDKAKFEAFRCGTHRSFFESKKHKHTNRPILGQHDLL